MNYVDNGGSISTALAAKQNSMASLAGFNAVSCDDISAIGSGSIITSTERTKVNYVDNGGSVSTALATKQDTLADLSAFTALSCSDISDIGSGSVITGAERTKVGYIDNGGSLTTALATKQDTLADLSAFTALSCSDILSVGSGAVMTSQERTDLGNKQTAAQCNALIAAHSDVLAGQTSSQVNTLVSSHSDVTSKQPLLDTATLFHDSGNSRVGLGTTSPSYRVHIVDSSDPTLKIERASNNYVIINESHILITKPNNTNYEINLQGNTQNLVFKTNNIERMRLNADGSLMLFALPTSASGLAVGTLFNAGGQIYIKQ